jgi:hypothetical protein
MAINETQTPFSEQFELLTDDDHRRNGGVEVGLNDSTYEPPPEGSRRVVPLGGGRRTDVPRSQINVSEDGTKYSNINNGGSGYNYNYNYDNNLYSTIINNPVVLPYIPGPGILIIGNLIMLDTDYVKSLFSSC